MNPELRSNVILSDEEKIILTHILRDRSTKHISSLTGISVSNVNSYRRKIRKKLDAKSNIHLIVSAILDYEFFRLLGSLNYYNVLLEDREREVLFLILKGFHNNEVAEKIGISVRSVEYIRSKFSVSNNAEFVKMCLEIGVLVIFPVAFSRKQMSVFGSEMDIVNFKIRSGRTGLNLRKLNHNGFIYFDYNNRFTFTTRKPFFDEPSFCNNLVIALKLSGYSDQNIMKIINVQDKVLSANLREVNESIEFCSIREYVTCCVIIKSLELNIKKTKIPNALIIGQKFLLEQLAYGRTSKEITERTKMKQSVLSEQKKILHTIWNSPSIVSIYITFLHLNYLQVKNKS